MADLQKKLLRQLGNRVSFKAPGERQGILKDRAIVFSGNGADGTEYWDVVDLIDFEGAEESWIRIGYYICRVDGSLIYGSQTTIAEPISTWRRLLVDAAHQKPWFREL